MHIYIYIYTILNYIINAPKFFGASVLSSGSFDVVFVKVIQYYNYLNYVTQQMVL